MKTVSPELLKVLVAAAESKNFYQAADRLQISQALVSIKLKELESQLPLPVFSFEGRKKILTKYGRDLYELARLQSRKWENALEKLNRKFSSVENLTLKIGGRPEVLDAFIPKMKFTGCLQIETMSSSQALEKLLEHELDIALTYRLPDSADLVAKKVLESTAQLMVHRQWIPKRVGQVIHDPDFLLKTPCIIYTAQAQLIRDWLDHLKISFDQIKVSTVSEDWRTIRKCIEEKRGYSIVPSYIQSLDSDVLTWPLPQSVLAKYNFFACFHKELKRVPAFRNFIEFK